MSFQFDGDFWSHAVNERQKRLLQKIERWCPLIMRASFQRHRGRATGDDQCRQDRLQHQRNAARCADAEMIVARDNLLRSERQ